MYLGLHSVQCVLFVSWWLVGRLDAGVKLLCEHSRKLVEDCISSRVPFAVT